jgi:hypothetical protein
MKTLFSIALLVALALLSLHGSIDPHAALAVAFAPAWVASDSTMSGQQLNSAYTIGANPAFLQGIEPSGMYVQGFDPSLGIGEFVYGQWSNATGCVAGNVCEGTQTLFTNGSSIVLITSFQLWQGTANSGKALGVALATLAQNQFGWFQIQGNALVVTNGTDVVGSPAYYQANGVVSSTAVASKQMLSSQFVVAASANFGAAVFVVGTGTVQPALSATNAVANVQSPHAQGAIT